MTWGLFRPFGEGRSWLPSPAGSYPTDSRRHHRCGKADMHDS
jgi:hypothetical protein